MVRLESTVGAIIKPAELQQAFAAACNQKSMRAACQRVIVYFVRRMGPSAGLRMEVRRGSVQDSARISSLPRTTLAVFLVRPVVFSTTI